MDGERSCPPGGKRHRHSKHLRLKVIRLLTRRHRHRLQQDFGYLNRLTQAAATQLKTLYGEAAGERSKLWLEGWPVASLSLIHI